MALYATSFISILISSETRTTQHRNARNEGIERNAPSGGDAKDGRAAAKETARRAAASQWDGDFSIVPYRMWARAQAHAQQIA